MFVRAALVVAVLLAPGAAGPVAAQGAADAAVRERAALAVHAPGQEQQRRPFRHARHRSVECTICHDTREAHGRVTLDVPRDCQLCHHLNAGPESCAYCHRMSGPEARTYTRTDTLHVAGRALERALPFDHGEHARFECTHCHSPADGQTLAVVRPCQECHSTHHEVQRDCAACHAQPATDVHPLASHVTCGGIGCHAPGFVEGEPRTRQVCLACHREQTDHRPGEQCADCHVLPPFRTSAGGAVP